MKFDHGYALLIGADVHLPIVVEDVGAIYDVLVDERRAGYPEAQVRVLGGGGATRGGILDALDWLADRAAQDAQSTVLVYYSGHGGRFERQNHLDDYYLIPEGYDDNDRQGTTVSGIEFTTKIQRIASQAKKLAVCLDCCHAAGIPTAKGQPVAFVKSPAPPQLLALEGGTGVVILASSRDGEKSYYGPKYSCFTECLLEAMAGMGSVTEDGYVRILEVLIYLFDHVPAKASGQGSQHPLVKTILDLGDNFPVCFYAGGEKALPVATPVVRPPLDASAWETGRLGAWFGVLERERDLRMQKVSHIREQLPVTLDPVMVFSLQEHLLREEVELFQLEQQIRSILSQLEERRGR